MKAAKGLRRMKNRVGTGVWLASGRQGLRLALPLALACAADKWRTRYPLRGGGAGHGARTARLTEGSGVFSCVWPAKQQIRWDLGTGALAGVGGCGRRTERTAGRSDERQWRAAGVRARHLSRGAVTGETGAGGGAGNWGRAKARHGRHRRSAAATGDAPRDRHEALRRDGANPMRLCGTGPCVCLGRRAQACAREPAAARLGGLAASPGHPGAHQAGADMRQWGGGQGVRGDTGVREGSGGGWCRPAGWWGRRGGQGRDGTGWDGTAATAHAWTAAGTAGAVLARKLWRTHARRRCARRVPGCARRVHASAERQRRASRRVASGRVESRRAPSAER